LKKILLIILVIALISAGVVFSFAADKPTSGKVVAYYFYGNFRCSTCYRLEMYSKEAIEANFKDAFSSGKLEFKVVNVEERGNEHFSQDYKLYTKSLILSLVKDGKEIKWKNLDKIWEHVGNKQRFIDYVKVEVADFLREAK
jgi:hypothetical protein